MAEGILLPQFIAPEPDLSGYSLITHTHTPASIGAAASSHSHSGYASSSHSHSGYATTSWVSANFAPKGSTGGGTTDPTPPTTGLGGMGTSTGSMTASSIDFSWTPVTPNNYSSANERYGAKIGTMLKINIPSAISSMNISWTAGNWTISCQDLLATAQYTSTWDTFSCRVCLTSSNSTSYGNPNADTSSGEVLFTRAYTSLFNPGGLSAFSNYYDEENYTQVIGTPFSSTKTVNTTAGSYTYPSSTIASIAGTSLYIVMVCTMKTWGGLNQTRRGTFTLNNTVNFTVRIS